MVVVNSGHHRWSPGCSVNAFECTKAFLVRLSIKGGVLNLFITASGLGHAIVGTSPCWIREVPQ